MTKKHFESVAAIIAAELAGKPACNRPDIARAVAKTAQRLADYFAAENPKFDRARFLTACGVADVEVGQ